MVTSMSWSSGVSISAVRREMDSRRKPVAGGGGVWGVGRPPPPLGQRLHRVQYKGPHFYQMRPPPPLGLRSTFPPNKTPPPPWGILATGLRRGMNAYMCGGKHGRQSHATSRIRLTYVNRTVLDGHLLGALVFSTCVLEHVPKSTNLRIRWRIALLQACGFLSRWGFCSYAALFYTVHISFLRYSFFSPK